MVSKYSGKEETSDKDNHAKWSNVKRQSTQDFPWSKSDGAAVTVEGSRHLS